MAHRDIVEPDYFLYAAGRAIAFARMAAIELDVLGDQSLLESDQTVAEYHAYAGISAARTSIDALSWWLNLRLALGLHGVATDLKKRQFRNKVTEKDSRLAAGAERVGDLAEVIDLDRQRAQHREGSAIVRYESAGWHLTEGLQSDRARDRHLPTLLRAWTDNVESELCASVAVLATRVGV